MINESSSDVERYDVGWGHKYMDSDKDGDLVPYSDYKELRDLLNEIAAMGYFYIQHNSSISHRDICKKWEALNIQLTQEIEDACELTKQLEALEKRNAELEEELRNEQASHMDTATTFCEAGGKISELKKQNIILVNQKVELEDRVKELEKEKKYMSYDYEKWAKALNSVKHEVLDKQEDD